MLKQSILTTAILLSMSSYAVQPTAKIKSINLSDNARIVGGQESSQNARPYQASVQGTDGYHFCGGSIVAADMILTAAHCLEGVDGESPNIQVRVGTNKLTGNEGETIAVAKTYTNQEYPNLSKDVAILKLEQAITHQNTQIINLVDQSFFDANIQAGTSLTVSGWGTLSSGGQSPDKLMEVDVPYVTNEVCNGSEAYGGQVQDTEICAGFKEGGKDSCQGDSGGPLVFEKNNAFYQVGVVSWGDGCAAANKYGVYGDVAKLRSWIDSAMAGNEPASGLAGGGDGGEGEYGDESYVAFQDKVSYTVGEEQLQLVLDVPEDINVIYIATRGGEGDVDITAERVESEPETNDEGKSARNANRWDNWDDWGDYWDMPVSFFSSENQGNEEMIIVEAPESGEWIISLSQFSDFKDVELTIFVH